MELNMSFNKAHFRDPAAVIVQAVMFTDMQRCTAHEWRCNNSIQPEEGIMHMHY